MDLTLNDVAKLLQVSPSAILSWVEEGKIPSYQINDEYRFNRIEIEEWLWRYLEQDEQPLSLIESPIGLNHFIFYRALHKGLVLRDIEGDTKEEVIENTMAHVADKLNLNAETFTNLLLDREKLSPTAINHGVAIPHARDFLISEGYDVLVVVFLKNPIDWNALDNEKIHTLFFLFACEDSRHLKLLGKIAYLCHQPEHLQMLKSRPDKPTLLRFLRQWESQLCQLQPA